jgi:hypothetical protein
MRKWREAGGNKNYTHFASIYKLQFFRHRILLDIGFLQDS